MRIAQVVFAAKWRPICHLMSATDVGIWPEREVASAGPERQVQEEALGGGDRSRTGDGGFAVVFLRPGKTSPAAALVSAATTAVTWSWEPATC